MTDKILYTLDIPRPERAPVEIRVTYVIQTEHYIAECSRNPDGTATEWRDVTYSKGPRLGSTLTFATKEKADEYAWASVAPGIPQSAAAYGNGAPIAVRIVERTL